MEGRPRDDSPRSTCSIAALISILVYAISGPCIIIVNKTVIKEHGLHAPALVSSMGILFTGVSTHLAATLGLVSITPLGDDRKSAVVPIIAVGVCTAGSFLLGNQAYVYLDASFLQMMKAATPAFLMVALMVFRIEKITLGVSLCSLVMVGGSILAVLHTPHSNAIGILIQLGSQGCEVMQNVLMQFFLQQLRFNALDAGYYIAPMSTICCFILSAGLEADTLRHFGSHRLLNEVPWLCASGLIGVAVNFSSFFVIQFISSLMAKLIVVARSACLVTVLILAYGEECTAMQLAGYAITLVAFAGYSALKTMESRELSTLPKGGSIEMSPNGGEQVDADACNSDEPLMGSKTVP